MRDLNKLCRFSAVLKDEDGAVTVDWVVLTAGIIALNIGLIVGLAESGINTASSGLYEALTSQIP